MLYGSHYLRFLFPVSISALCMVIACVSFPFGWNSDEFRKICGPESNRFEVGLCGLRWAYPLAIIGIMTGSVDEEDVPTKFTFSFQLASMDSSWPLFRLSWLRDTSGCNRSRSIRAACTKVTCDFHCSASDVQKGENRIPTRPCSASRLVCFIYFWFLECF